MGLNERVRLMEIIENRIWEWKIKKWIKYSFFRKVV
jgi:hypothetical protein